MFAQHRFGKAVIEHRRAWLSLLHRSIVTRPILTLPFSYTRLAECLPLCARHQRLLVRTLYTSQPFYQSSGGQQSGKQDDGDKEGDDQSTMLKKAFFMLVGSFLTVYIFSTMINVSSQDNASMRFISWNEFLYQMLAKGEVEEVIIRPEMDLATVLLYDDAIIGGRRTHHRTFHIQVPDIKMFEDQLRKAEQKLGIPPGRGVMVVYERNYSSGWLTLLSLVTLSLMLMYMMRSGTASILRFENFDMFNIRRAKFRLVDPNFRGLNNPKIKFADVAGLHEAKIEIKEFVDYLKRPETFTRLGAKLPKGALLTGPPGCGKTLLAKAVASEASVPFLAVNGTEFVEMIGGLGAARVRDLFKEAKRRSPCIIYVDEIDALGRHRDGGSSKNAFMSTSEEEQTLNQLLVEMDGMDTVHGVIVLASTNRADILDKALLRRGRFDRHISIDPPTRLERKETFDYYLRKIKLHGGVSDAVSAKLASLTPGFTGADIANVVNESALHAATAGSKEVTLADLDYALERIVAGSQKKSTTLSPAEKEIVAFHESGHALAGWLLKHTDALLKISIIPRTGAALGFAQYNPQDRKLFSKDELFDRMCMALGGRAAENVQFGRISTGAEDDLRKVTRIAYDQVRIYGMSEIVGPLSFAPPPGEERSSQFMKKPYSKRFQAVMDQEASRMVGEAYRYVESLIREHKDKLETLATTLIKKEVLNYDDVKSLIGMPPFGDKRTIESIELVLPPAAATSEGDLKGGKEEAPGDKPQGQSGGAM